jgi:hypothetical protein
MATFEEAKSKGRNRHGVCPRCGRRIQPREARGVVQTALVANVWPEGEKRRRDPVNSLTVSYCESCSVEVWMEIEGVLEGNDGDSSG